MDTARWQRWQTLRPRLHRDGISLPAALLLKQLKSWLDSDELTVEDLLLDEHGAVFWLHLHHPAATILQLHCQPEPVTPGDDSLRLRYHLQADDMQPGLRGHLLGKAASLAANSGMATRLLQRLAASLPWLAIDQQHLTLHWRDIPAVQRWLHTTVLGYQPLQSWRIAAVHTCHDCLRLQLKRRQSDNQG